jgi:hypothetical protein
MMELLKTTNNNPTLPILRFGKMVSVVSPFFSVCMFEVVLLVFQRGEKQRGRGPTGPPNANSDMLVVIGDVGVINNLWLCEPPTKIDHANPLLGKVKIAIWTCNSQTTSFS